MVSVLNFTVVGLFLKASDTDELMIEGLLQKHVGVHAYQMVESLSLYGKQSG